MMKLFTAPKVVLSVIFLTVLLAFMDHLLTLLGGKHQLDRLDLLYSRSRV